MFDRKSWILNRLKDMPLYEIDRRSGMEMRGTDGWERVAGPIRSTLVDAYTNDGIDRGDLPASVASYVDGLLPTAERDVIWELTVIASAWSLTHSADEGFQVAEGETFIDAAKSALERAYEDGMRQVVDALEREADDADDEGGPAQD